MSKYDIIGLHTNAPYAFSVESSDRWAWLGRQNNNQKSNLGVARAEAVVLTAHNALHEVLANIEVTVETDMQLKLALLITNAVTNPLIRHKHSEIPLQSLGVIEYDLISPRKILQVNATSGLNLAASSIARYPGDYVEAVGDPSKFTAALLTFVEMIAAGNPINPKSFSLDEKGALVHNHLVRSK